MYVQKVAHRINLEPGSPGVHSSSQPMAPLVTFILLLNIGLSLNISCNKVCRNV